MPASKKTKNYKIAQDKYIFNFQNQINLKYYNS